MEKSTVLFARSMHPEGWNISHGYVVIAVICSSPDQIEAVRNHVAVKGIRLPDAYRMSQTGRLPASRAEAIEKHRLQWYGGGGGAFDHLCTITGEPVGDNIGLGGDFRLFGIYDADEILNDPWVG